jgi:pimeloyl-ACP methyl ester carboxylesterase
LQELSIRQFLLTNSLIDKQTKTLKFRIPLPILSESIPAIGHFPYAPGEAEWNGPALFIKGAKARYITERNEPITREFFPNLRLETFDSGHWVHAEKPLDFVKTVKEFVEQMK